jgi:hypothetical protein
MLYAIGVEPYLSKIVAMKKIKGLSLPTRARGLGQKPNAREKFRTASRRLATVPIPNLINPPLRDV